MDRLPANIELELAVHEQSPILANLLELYAHDFSEFQPLDIGSDGRFGYKYLPLYWSESNRHPFLIRFDAKLTGLALVKRGSEISDNQDVWVIHNQATKPTTCPLSMVTLPPKDI